MEKFETASRRKRILRVNHAEPGEFRLNYILLPAGYAYEKQYKDIKKGDTLRLFDGGDYTIYSIRKIKLNKPEADILCRMRYGVTILRVLQIWQSNALMEGHGKKAVSEEDCFWVVYGEEK